MKRQAKLRDILAKVKQEDLEDATTRLHDLVKKGVIAMERDENGEVWIVSGPNANQIREPDEELEIHIDPDTYEYMQDLYHQLRIEIAEAITRLNKSFWEQFPEATEEQFSYHMLYLLSGIEWHTHRMTAMAVEKTDDDFKIPEAMHHVVGELFDPKVVSLSWDEGLVSISTHDDVIDLPGYYPVWTNDESSN